MKHENGIEIFKKYLSKKNLKYSEQRIIILEVFLATEKHLTAEELYELVRKKQPSIGYATIYRTLKLLCECGISRELKFNDGLSRYEHLYGHKHHDHLICMKCGKYTEVLNKEIEKLQEKLAREEGFKAMKHKLEIYGLCKSCNK